MRNYIKKIGDFYCLSCLHSFKTKNKLESHKRVCENIMPSEHTKILQFNQYQKSDKAPFFIYVDCKCIIGRIDGCINNPEN